MTESVPDDTQLLAMTDSLEASFRSVQEVVAGEFSAALRHASDLPAKEQMILGGFQHGVTLIRHGLALFRDAVRQRERICVPAIVVRPLIEWCIRLHWLLCVADDISVAAILSEEAVDGRRKMHVGLQRLLADCRKHEEEVNGSRESLLSALTDRLDDLNALVHGDPDVLISGISAEHVRKLFSNSRIENDLFAVGSMMFLMHEDIAKIVKAGKIQREHINAKWEEFNDLFRSNPVGGRATPPD